MVGHPEIEGGLELASELPVTWESARGQSGSIGYRANCSLAYSTLACSEMGMSESASFQRIRKFL